MARNEKSNKWGVPGAVVIFLPLLFFLWLISTDVNTTTLYKGLNYGSNQTSTPSNNNYLHELIPSNFDNESCLSRFEWPLFRKSSPYMPSSYLLQKLRNYETLHKKCGPNTPLYQKSIQQLNSGHSIESMECNYVVWIPLAGLGNRMLSLISTFFYAIITNRVMLIQLTDELVDLFCEPFPDTSWILPPDFPIKNLDKFDVNSNVTYGNMLDKHVIISNHSYNTKVESLPSYVYVYLVDNYRTSDMMFFCNDDQIVLGKVNWLLLKSDLYFLPSLCSSTPMFEEELGRLFPAKESVFYLLAHYLIHPSNNVWGLVRRYYMSYLAKADEKIGIQVRVFWFAKVSSDVIFQQILKCAKMENVFPELDSNGTKFIETDEQKPSKAILVASLYASYYEKFKSMYYEHSVKTGELVSVYQPSHEEKQNTENQSHNQKALAEIYLLSLCDVLMTSGWSTFGYVSSGLAGIKPLILMPVWHKKVAEMPCVREASMEPCNLSPTKVRCKGKIIIEKERLQQYVKQCPDIDDGIKLFD
ncbi:Galactoside 2-alpha-L-fucosyltransferase [Carex littledalei]|uniref:Fucosyltransferase n=1 Tax=Carex littledalei TaxID=544730 RepID=A0A833RBB7_9POAL|nr:Galactoside 2-alpha-L-fucosyltransferase [Carex littledalei]